MRHHAPAQRAGQRPAEGDAVPLDGDVDVEARLVHEEIANGPADQVDAVEPLGDGLHRLEDAPEPLDREQPVPQVGPGLGRLLGQRFPEGPEEIAPCHDPDDDAVGEHRHPPRVRAAEQPRQLRERRLLGAGGHLGAHDTLDRSVGELVPDRLVEVLAGDEADEAIGVPDEDPALAVALAEDHRVRHGVLGGDEPRGMRHDLRGGPQRPNGPRQGLEDELARLGEGPVVDGRRGLRMSPAAEGGRDGRGVQLGDARPHDAEDAALHLDEADERPRVGEVDDLVGEVRDAVDVLGPGDGRNEDLQPAGGVRLDRADECVEQRALLVAERRAEVLRDHVLASSVTKAPRERLRVAHADARIAEGARVLVDPEREDGRLERRHVDLALGEDADHRRRQGGVVREDEVLGLHPVGRLAGVVVEDDDLHVGVPRHVLELPEALGMHRLHDDQPPDRVPVEAPRLDDVELVGVEPVELAHVAVERPREGDDRPGVEPARGQHGRERVEVRVRVRDDDVHTRKVRPAPGRSPFLGMRGLPGGNRLRPPESGLRVVQLEVSRTCPSAFASPWQSWSPPSQARRRSRLRRPAPTGLAVADLVSDTGVFDPQLSWTAVSGAKGYQVEINPTDTWASGSKVCCNNIGSTMPVTTVGTSFSPPVVLPNDDEYYWRVRAIDASNNAGPWTAGSPFSKSYGSTPSVPNIRLADANLDAIAAGSTVATPIVLWDPSPGASSYRVQVTTYGLGRL